MRSFRWFQFAVFAALIGSSSAYAAPTANTTMMTSLDPFCRPMSASMESCAVAACGALSAAQTQPEGEQRALGRQVAAVVRAVGEYDAASADKIQGCVAGSSALVIAGFEDNTDDGVADIGDPRSASAQ